MASARPTYLVDFDPILNCRPVYFVKPLPDIRYCRICNVVPQKTYLLAECLHTFCKSCYDGILAKGQTCPLDGIDFDAEVVRDIAFTPDRLAQAIVRCQNWKSGCAFVGSAMDSVEHCVDSCDFHVVICQRCGEGVHKYAMMEHYANGDCKVKEASDHSFPSCAPYLGKVSEAQIPGLVAPTLITPSSDAKSAAHSSFKSRQNSVDGTATPEFEIAYAEDILSKSTVRTSYCKGTEYMSPQEEQRFRTNTVGAVTKSVSAGGSNLRSCLRERGPRSSETVRIYIGRYHCIHEKSSFFTIGNCPAYLTAFLPNNGNIKVYLAVRQSTNNEHVLKQDWYKLVIKCVGHQSLYQTVITTPFIEEYNVKRGGHSVGFFPKPLFDIVSCAYVPYSVANLQSKDWAKDGYLRVAVEV